MEYGQQFVATTKRKFLSLYVEYIIKERYVQIR